MRLQEGDLVSGSVFSFDSARKERAHGPEGYVDYESFQPWLRDEFTFRCAYCLIRERWYPNGHRSFSIDHFIPQTVDDSRRTDYENLIYTCGRCNAYKRDSDGVLDPCAIAMGQHLRMGEDSIFEPLTDVGELHIEVLRLNHPEYIEYRRRVIRILQEAYSDEDTTTLKGWCGFPDSLPDLKALRPPAGNRRPDGARDCYFQKRQENRLPEVY